MKKKMKKKISILWVLALTGGVALPTVLLTGGCGGAKHRTVDVAAGEYYTEDEIAEFPDSKKDKYCRTLETERAQTQQTFEAMTAELAQTTDKIAAARTSRDRLERELLSVESDLRTLDDQLEEVRALPKTWKIRPGESLSSIAALPEIYNDVDKWWKLYEVNKDKVPDPYFCFPDTVIVIPRDWPVD